MELFPLAPSQGSRTCARWPLCLALGVVRRRMYLAAVASPTERPLRVVHPFLVPQCLKEPGLPSPDKLREYANVGSFRWSVLGRGMFIHASASGTRLQQNAHLRRVFLKKEEFTRRFESVIEFTAKSEKKKRVLRFLVSWPNIVDWQCTAAMRPGIFFLGEGWF